MRRLEVRRAEVVQHPDDAIASEVRRVRHRRPPVAVPDAGVLVEQVRMLRDERANARRRRRARSRRSAGTAETSRAQLGACSCARARAARRPAWRSRGRLVRDGDLASSATAAVSPRRMARRRSLAWCLSCSRSGRTGSPATGHDEPPWRLARRPLASGDRRFVWNRAATRCYQVDSVLPADGRRPARLARRIASPAFAVNAAGGDAPPGARGGAAVGRKHYTASHPFHPIARYAPGALGIRLTSDTAAERSSRPGVRRGFPASPAIAPD